MGVVSGAEDYRGQHNALCYACGRAIGAHAMTTDPEEGRRQIEAMKPDPIKVGDKVKLSAGGERVMTVVELQDYDNKAVCEWEEPTGQVPGTPEGMRAMQHGRDTFPVRALVRVEAAK